MICYQGDINSIDEQLVNNGNLLSPVEETSGVVDIVVLTEAVHLAVSSHTGNAEYSNALMDTYLYFHN